MDEAAAATIACSLKMDLPSPPIAVVQSEAEAEKFQAVDLLQMLLVEAADGQQVIKGGKVFMMRMGGFPHKLTRKPVKLLFHIHVIYCMNYTCWVFIGVVGSD